MFTLYSSKNKVDFEFEDQQKTIAEAVEALGKWLSIRVMSIDPEIAKDEKTPATIKENWFVFKGRDNISGRLIGSVSIEIKRH